ncbi:hypothetical protein TKK_0017888 [Trichogramma kaykai]
MISFKISAPGKVILFGEHAVVYGKTALAASVNLRSHLYFSELASSSENHVHIDMPLVSLNKKVPLSLIRSNLLAPDFPMLSIVGHDIFYDKIEAFVKLLECADPRQFHSLLCLFYALTQTVQDRGLTVKPFKIKLETELPIGAGAGSSASFAVCLTAAFIQWARLQSPEADAASLSSFDFETLGQVSTHAYNCEKIMHGRPSGIDNSVCTYGAVIQFQRNEPIKCRTLGDKQFRALLVDTKVGRSTKDLVARLAQLKSSYPQIFDKVINAIDEVSLCAIDLFHRMESLDECSDRMEIECKELMNLIHINQGLLNTCQVSHASLDTICIIARNHGLAAKLTGAGGGGFAYVLIPPYESHDKVQKLNSELVSNGFSVTETILGGSGVQIHSV